MERFTTGQIVSGIGHLGLILFLLFGGLFSRAPLPAPDVAQVELLSEEEFKALTRPDVAPEPAAPPPAPEPEPEPELEPEPAAEPEPEPAPEPEPEPLLEPQAATPPPPAEELPLADRDVPRPAPRVASEPTPPSRPETETAPEITEAPAPEPDEAAEDIVEDETDAAPPETATEIVTEAEEPATTAPTRSQRPAGRPARPTRAAETPAPQTEQTSSSASSENVRDSVEEAIAGLEEQPEPAAPEQDVPMGPPLTSGEKDSFRLAVSRCWLVDTGSEAANVTVTIRFDMTEDARVVSNSIQQVAASGGSDAAIRSAYDSGRRAILRCQNEGGGYDLPQEKYGQWREIELTFNPDGMRLR